MKRIFKDFPLLINLLLIGALVVSLVNPAIFKTEKAQALSPQKILFFTGFTDTWVVPNDWNSYANKIETVGGGGSGSLSGTDPSGGGGGGAYSSISNSLLTPGATIGVSAGFGGGESEDGEDSFFCNSDTNCASLVGTAVIVGAQGGFKPTGIVGGAGGAAGSGVGPIKYSGGTGGNAASGSTRGAGGGGAAAGPNGLGANGGAGSSALGGGGGGGGGANGGIVGSSAGATSPGAAGGNNRFGRGGGAGGSSATGTVGTLGGGGGGGGGSTGTGSWGGAAGSADISWTGLFATAGHPYEGFSTTTGLGSGGGGGGGGATGSTGGTGGNGGGWGAGGGGSGEGDASPLPGTGSYGIVVVTYTPVTRSLKLFEGMKLKLVSGKIVIQGVKDEQLVDNVLGVTNIGDMTVDPGNNPNGLVAAFDGVTDTAGNTCTAHGSAVEPHYVGKTLTGSKRFLRALIFGGNNSGFLSSSNANVTLQIYGKTGAAPSTAIDGTILASSTFDDTTNESQGRSFTSINPTSSWDHLWVTLSTPDTIAAPRICEVQMYVAYP